MNKYKMIVLPNTLSGYMICDNDCKEPWGINQYKIYHRKNLALDVVAEFYNLNLRVIHCNIVFVKP